MGRIFSFREIEAGSIPDLADFVSVKKMIEEQLGRAEGIVSALVCGSVAMEAHDRRSDIDCVVIFHVDEFHSTANLLAGISREASRVHVPVEFIPVDLRTATHPFHHISPSLFAHITEVSKRGVLVKKNPATILCEPAGSMRDWTINYLRNKVRRLEKGLFRPPELESEQEQMRLLQKILESPVHIARMMLAQKGVLGKDDSRKEVVRLYRATFQGASCGLLDYLIRTDEEYALELERQIMHADPIIYAQMLATIRERGFQAIEFARMNLFDIGYNRV